MSITGMYCSCTSIASSNCSASHIARNGSGDRYLTGKECKKFSLQLPPYQGLHLLDLQAAQNELDAARQPHRAAASKLLKRAGGDPTFSAFSRPKSSWGRSRALQEGATVALSRSQAIVLKSSKVHIVRGRFKSWQSSGRNYFRLPATRFSFPTLNR
jgi:hypothetical protein